LKANFKKALQNEFGSKVKFDSKTNWILEKGDSAVIIQIEKQKDWANVSIEERKSSESNSTDPLVIKSFRVDEFRAGKENLLVSVWQDYDDINKTKNQNSGFDKLGYGMKCYYDEHIIEIIKKVYKGFNP